MTGIASPAPSRRSRGTVALADAVGRVTAILTAAGVPSPGVDARWLVAHAAGSDPRVAGERPLTAAAGAALEDLVRRRAGREPLQLVLGECDFRVLRLLCAPGVFVPRPETEVVAGVAIDLARAAGPRPLVAEPCTGSGAIACSLAAEVVGARVLAADVDARAVAAARHNARRLSEGAAGPAGTAPGATVEIRHAPLLADLPEEVHGRLDVLVANPPYLPAADRGTWEPEVARHDPDAALVGGADGHEVVTELTAAAGHWLRPGGALVLEIDARRSDEACATAREAGLVDVRAMADLTGAPRVLIARRAPAAT